MARRRKNPVVPRPGTQPVERGAPKNLRHSHDVEGFPSDCGTVRSDPAPVIRPNRPTLMPTPRRLAGFAMLLSLAIIEPSPASAQGPDLAAQVKEKAALAVSQFQKRAAGRLDYSEQSLAVVEDMLAEASRYTREMPPSDVKALVELMGSYILEVAHRRHGGTFQWHDARAQPLLVVGLPRYSVAIMTFDKVRSRLAGDPADNIVFFYQGFSERAKTAQPGTRALYA